MKTFKQYMATNKQQLTTEMLITVKLTYNGREGLFKCIKV